MKPTAAARVAALLFPVLVLAGVWGGLDRRWLALALGALLAWRYGRGIWERFGPWWLGAAVCGALGLTWLRADLALKAYPIAVNLALLGLFGHSLGHPPSVVERLARLTEPDLDEAGVRYTRGVTQVWCVFFVLNALLSLATACLASERIWALYNGAVSYALMGLLFAVEWLWRRRVRARKTA